MGVGSSSQNETIERDDLQWISTLKKKHNFVWCDASIGCPTKKQDDMNTLAHLTRILNKHRQLIHTFNDQNVCESFIKKVNNVCLITSGAMGKEFVPIIHSYKQVKFIYIFCLRKSEHISWSSNYRKVRAVESQIKLICEKIKVDLISEIPVDFDKISFDVVSSNEETTKTLSSNLNIVYQRFLKNFFSSENHSELGKIQRLISYFREEFFSEDLVDFIMEIEENYSPEKVIQYFTRDYFLQGTLNRAFQERNLSKILSMSKIIFDIERELKRLRTNSTFEDETIRVYFGQSMSREEFNRLKSNENGLLIIDQYILANSEESILRSFIKQNSSSNRTDRKVSLLFEVLLDTKTTSIVNFAKIGAATEFVHEKEFLISFAGIYRIERIERIPELSAVFSIQIRLLTQNEVREINFSNSLMKKFENQNDLTSIDKKLRENADLFTMTGKLFKRSLMADGQIFRCLMLHFDVALFLSAIDDFQNSLEEFRFTLAIGRFHIRQIDNQIDLCFAPLYGHMALVYQKLKQNDIALEYAFRALQIASQDVKNDRNNELKASTYEILGILHNEQQKFNEAKEFYQGAISIRKTYSPSTQLRIQTLNKKIDEIEQSFRF